MVDFLKRVAGATTNKRDSARGRKEGIFRMADLEILLYVAFQTPKLRLNPDSLPQSISFRTDHHIPYSVHPLPLLSPIRPDVATDLWLCSGAQSPLDFGRSVGGLWGLHRERPSPTLFGSNRGRTESTLTKLILPDPSDSGAAHSLMRF